MAMAHINANPGDFAPTVPMPGDPLRAALYMNAARLNKRTPVSCTVSNHILAGEETGAEAGQTSFGERITLALETARTQG